MSKHCEEGAMKYGEHNVDKGIPLHSLLDSASRHLAKYMVGMDDEDLLWALNQRETHPELDDRFVVKAEDKKKDEPVKKKDWRFVHDATALLEISLEPSTRGCLLTASNMTVKLIG